MDPDIASAWETLRRCGMSKQTVAFFIELALLNDKRNSLHYLIEAGEGYREWIEQPEQFEQTQKQMETEH
jgi:hypothetical protein